MQHKIIDGKKTGAIGTTLSDVSVSDPDKGTVVLRSNGKDKTKEEVQNQLLDLKNKGKKVKGDEFDGQSISF